MQDVLAQLGLVGYNGGLDLSCIPCLSYSNKQRWTFFQALLTKNLDAKRRNEEQIF